MKTLLLIPVLLMFISCTHTMYECPQVEEKTLILIDAGPHNRWDVVRQKWLEGYWLQWRDTDNQVWCQEHSLYKYDVGEFRAFLCRRN